MKGSGVISALKKKLRVNTDRDLAVRLGITTQAIQNWKNRKAVTERQLAGLVNRASGAGAKNMQANAIRPLVEFFRIERSESRQGAKYELFKTKDDDGDKRAYFDGLRKELDSHHGVYMFFDSRGQAIYAGKARRQSLWKEMKLAFNRKRGKIQKIKRVKHPTRKRSYSNSEEKVRQIIDQEVPLHELAAYFSAYQVTDGMIGEVEAMLVRSFANNLLNKKMERFSQQKRRS